MLVCHLFLYMLIMDANVYIYSVSIVSTAAAKSAPAKDANEAATERNRKMGKILKVDV